MAPLGSPDPELDAFVTRYVVSFAAWDLLVLLHGQPSLRTSAKRIAYRLGRGEQEVAVALQALCRGGAIDAGHQDGEEVFSLVPKVQPLLARFVEASADRDWRLELVGRVLSRIGTV